MYVIFIAKRRFVQDVGGNMTIANTILYETLSGMASSLYRGHILFFILKTSHFNTEDQRIMIANAICPISFNNTLRALSSTRTKDTGMWLLEDHRFMEWKSGHSGNKVLWLVGERKFSQNRHDHFQTYQLLAGIGKTYLLCALLLVHENLSSLFFQVSRD
jgi:hypothetical protein